MTTRSFRLSYANAMSTIAVFLALGGSAAAAKGLISGRDVRNESLTGTDIKNGSLTRADLSPSALGLGTTTIQQAGREGVAGRRASAARQDRKALMARRDATVRMVRGRTRPARPEEGDRGIWGYEIVKAEGGSNLPGVAVGSHPGSTLDAQGTQSATAYCRVGRRVTRRR